MLILEVTIRCPAGGNNSIKLMLVLIEEITTYSDTIITDYDKRQAKFSNGLRHKRAMQECATLLPGPDNNLLKSLA